MVVEALGLLFERITEANWKVGNVRGIFAAGQVSLVPLARADGSNTPWYTGINHPRPSSPHSTLANPCPSSLKDFPSWQDSSTTAECRAIEAAFESPEALARATGSKAHERCTGPQIMRFKRIDSVAYDATERISLVSSFVITLVCSDGETKVVDESDA